MLEPDEGSIQSDAYIDALLRGHERLPITLRPSDSPPASVRRVIRILESGLPRFHPSFLFEERLSEQLRAAAGTTAEQEPLVFVDRRLLMGGAIASGVSIGAAAMLAWRRRHE